MIIGVGRALWVCLRHKVEKGLWRHHGLPFFIGAQSCWRQKNSTNQQSALHQWFCRCITVMVIICQCKFLLAQIVMINLMHMLLQMQSYHQMCTPYQSPTNGTFFDSFSSWRLWSLQIMSKSIHFRKHEINITFLNGLIGNDATEKVGEFSERLVADHDGASRHHSSLN